MSKNDVHVVPVGNGWAVKQEGNDEPKSKHRWQRTALVAGRKLAKRMEGELVIHRPDGRIRDHNDYGRSSNGSAQEPS